MGAPKWLGGAVALIMLLAAPSAWATTSVDPASVDLGNIKNGAAGGRVTSAVTYSISADEKNRYAFNQTTGGDPDGSTQFSVGGGNCATAFPTLLGAPASCTIVIQFDYSGSARGLSSGMLVIDADANFSTTADETSVPLRAVVSAGAAHGERRRCRKKTHRHRSASAAKKKCKKRKR